MRLTIWSGAAHSAPVSGQPLGEDGEKGRWPRAVIEPAKRWGRSRSGVRPETRHADTMNS